MTRTMIRGAIGALAALALVVVGCKQAGPNSTPTADAGPDQTVTASDTVTLQGSGTDVEDESLTFS